MTEGRDEFYINEQAAVETPTEVTAPQEAFIDTITHPEGEDDLVVLDPEDVKVINGEEAGFALVAEATENPQDQILLFGEFRELYRRVVDAVELKGYQNAASVRRKAGQFMIGTMIALGLNGAVTKSAEAIDWKRAIQTGVTIGGRIGAQHFERQAQKHAEEARFLAEAPRRIRELQRQITRWNGMIENAMKQLDAAKTEERKEVIESDVEEMRFARSECIRELEWMMKRLQKADREGRTAESEMERAEREAMKSEISSTIAHEAEWAHITWGWNSPF